MKRPQENYDRVPLIPTFIRVIAAVSVAIVGVLLALAVYVIVHFLGQAW